MEWWQQLVVSLVTILFGALLGYCFSRIGAKQEKKSRTQEKLEEAISGILVELETDLKLAEYPFQNRLVPFVNSMWEVHKAEIPRLPKELKDVLYQVYIEIEMANNLVEADIHQLEYGRGYYNEPYKERCNRITEKAEEAIKLLSHWLNQEGVQVANAGEEAVAIDLKTFSLSKIRKRYPRAYEKWMDEEDTRLKRKFSEGLSVQELAKLLQRQPSAIHSRLRRLGLME